MLSLCPKINCFLLAYVCGMICRRMADQYRLLEVGKVFAEGTSGIPGPDKIKTAKDHAKTYWENVKSDLERKGLSAQYKSEPSDYSLKSNCLPAFPIDTTWGGGGDNQHKQVNNS
jgi:hypothetical protein